MGWLWHHLHNYNDCKTKETWMHKTKQMNCMMSPLTAGSSWNDPSGHWIENICHVELKNNLVNMKV
jgi:hypothetical protein